LLQEKLAEVFGELLKKGTFRFDQEPFRRELTGSIICWVKYTKYLTPKITLQAEKTVDMKYLERHDPEWNIEQAILLDKHPDEPEVGNYFICK
jgi:hypothetical protein